MASKEVIVSASPQTVFSELQVHISECETIHLCSLEFHIHKKP